MRAAIEAQTMSIKVLITCPPMLGIMQEFKPYFTERGIEVVCPRVVQTLSESQIIDLVPQCDGWIIGDDPATAAVFRAGRSGRLKAAVKWGVGVDNVDVKAAKMQGIPVTNTPDMFGGEVADLAMAYVTILARETCRIDREVRGGGWPKPRGISLQQKVLGLIGFGDIGKHVARRALAAGMAMIVYDPAYRPDASIEGVSPAEWPSKIEACDFLVLTCSLNDANRHMLNQDTLQRAKPGVRIVNVARGALIDEAALVTALTSGQVHSAALDVYETEPLPLSSPLRGFECCVFGSHNASNTSEAVWRTSERAAGLLCSFLGLTDR
ncbi:MAG: phosphoglycerate dehydrogenase [Gammaproteobacteria bacterium]